MNAATANQIPVTLLTGYLGSGKTTMLNHLVHQPEFADTLIIINEFGAIALDHLLVAHSTENLVMEMSSGCLCCTIRTDLIKTLQDITWRFSRGGQRQFQRVLIETTGLADPAPIIHTLMTHPKITQRYRLDGVVATVDMVAGMRTLDQHAEALKQVAMADVLLLTKTDLVQSEQRQTLLNRLQKMNPAAARFEVQHGVLNAQNVLNLGWFAIDGKTGEVQRWLQQQAYPSSHDHLSESHDHHPEHQHHDVNRHDGHIQAFCLHLDQPITPDALSTWLAILKDFMGQKILRIKGILNVKGNTQPIVVHGVQHVLHPLQQLPAWPSADRRSRIVFITQDVQQKTIEQTCQVLEQSSVPQTTVLAS